MDPGPVRYEISSQSGSEYENQEKTVPDLKRKYWLKWKTSWFQELKALFLKCHHFLFCFRQEEAAGCPVLHRGGRDHHGPGQTSAHARQV